MSKKESTKEHFAEYAPWFVDVFDDLAYAQQGEQARVFINTPRYTVKDSNATYRVINTWAAQGLLPERREENTSWRKLSLKDLIWLEILKELREFGLPLEKARKAYQCLVVSEKGLERPHLEVALGLAIRTTPLAVFVVVFQDGSADIATNECIDFTDHVHGYQSFLRLNVNQLLRRVFPQTPIIKAAACRIPLQPNDMVLDVAEREIIGAVREEENEQIHIRKKSGVIDAYETISNIPKPQAFQILQEMRFGEVAIQNENGVPVHARVTRKIKVKK